MDKAKRYNKGKNRLELIPVRPLKLIGDVYTRGAHKYSVYRDENGYELLGKDIPIEDAHKYELIESGADNWRKGLSWTENIGSVKRHIAAYEDCQDYDPELLTLHLANAAWGLFSALEMYSTHPEFDDRQHRYLKRPKIGLDIDNVVADWTIAWGEKHGIDRQPASWRYNYKNKEWLTPSAELDEWYKTIPPAINPKEIPFEPHAYITARSVDEQITKDWLQYHGFPTAPIFTVPFGASKVDIAKQAGIEWFIDDSYDNFVELNRAGICTFLWDQSHNRRYEVGYKRVTSFKDFKERFL
jgi:hypothetical protein